MEKMKKVFLLIALSFITFKSFASVDPSVAAPAQKFAAGVLRLADAVDTKSLKVVPGKITGFNNYVQEERNMLTAFDIVENVINSEEFKTKVISYLSKNGQRTYTNNKGLTNEQVYETIMNGKELLNGDNTLGEMNFDVDRYSRFWSKVIGYTNIGKDNVIHVNGKFYKNYSPAEITGNITHEWLHLMGFVHSSASDHDSIPYAVGYIMGDLAEKFVQQGFLQ